jgi:hypothetical protein
VLVSCGLQEWLVRSMLNIHPHAYNAYDALQALFRAFQLLLDLIPRFAGVC